MANSEGLGSWSDLQFVIAVARSGSFFKAATSLRTNPSTVARRIQRLETRLGTKIFDRHAHGMQLTPPGALLFENVIEMEEVANRINAHLSALDILPKGIVKIAVTEGVGYLWLTPKIAEFCAMHDDIDIEIITNPDGIDLLSHETDIAVMLDRPDQPRLVVVLVASIKFALFASEAYRKRVGLPGPGHDFSRHEFVDYLPNRRSPDVATWLDRTISAHRVRLRTNSASVYLAGIREGLGIGLLPMFYQVSAPDLIILDDPALDCSANIWLVSHEETNKARRIRLLLEFLKDRFRKDRDSWF